MGILPWQRQFGQLVANMVQLTSISMNLKVSGIPGIPGCWCLHQVFTWCPPSSLLRSACACHAWRKAAESREASKLQIYSENEVTKAAAKPVLKTKFGRLFLVFVILLCLLLVVIGGL